MGIVVFVTQVHKTEGIGENQAWILQLSAHQLGTWVVRGSIPGKGDNFSMKISN